MPEQEVDLKLVGGRVVTGGGVLQAGVAVDGSTIVAVARDDLLPTARRTIDVRGSHILGIVDSEAHPGCYVPFEEDLELSRAAACAGITTWGIQAPSTRLGTRPFKEYVQATDVVPFSHAFATARETIERVSSVDCFLTFMMETDAQAEEIPLYCEYEVTSYKLYMQARRIPAADHNWPSRQAGLGVGIDDGTLYLVMEQVARYGAPAICSIHRRTGRSPGCSSAACAAKPATTTWPPGPTARPTCWRPSTSRPTPMWPSSSGRACTSRHHPRDLRGDPRGRRRGGGAVAQTGPAWLGFSPFDGWRINVPLRYRDTQEAL